MTTALESTKARDVSISKETETKFELDAAAFERLKSAALITHFTEQLNVYYDCAWELAEHAGTFRVRFAQGTGPVVTLKLPVSSTERRRVMYELETTPDRCFGGRRLPSGSIRVNSQLPEEFEDALLGMGISELSRVGWVRNQRWSLDVDGDTLELDRLKLPNGEIVYEAEIETPNIAVHARLATWIKHLAPAARPSDISKFQRFRIALAASALQTSGRPLGFLDQQEMVTRLIMPMRTVVEGDNVMRMHRTEGAFRLKDLIQRALRALQQALH